MWSWPCRDEDVDERFDDDMAIAGDFDDDPEHEVAADADADAEAEPDVGSEEFEAAVEEEAPHDQPDDNTGQVFLGSGNRPWDRGESDG